MSTAENRYPWFGQPPARTPQPSAKVPALMGKRVILSTPEGFVYDMRAAGERYIDAECRDLVDIVTEEAWYRWMLLGKEPRKAPWAAHLVWVE
ncbi:hypothetical protein [Nocardioides jejuensis]|uniref:Uncharacterized protein n=1 Tax=Nocardioides jejuensis TaxID=2502782 RepID=A0A4R1CIB3_9ACTN|nr:hypothetical protein [Nocardioides jejuensis]TCJ31060.1 hypothetical protein EPD65_00335 [Nocardioides jejuensis]